MTMEGQRTLGPNLFVQLLALHLSWRDARISADDQQHTTP